MPSASNLSAEKPDRSFATEDRSFCFAFDRRGVSQLTTIDNLDPLILIRVKSR
jgi:hypothetical protein